MKEFYQNKKVLVTGHTTFIGSWLSMSLHSLGAEVIGCSSKPVSYPNLFIEADIDELVNSYIGDIRDYNFLSTIFNETQPEIVIHLSPVCGFCDDIDPKDLYAVNLLGTLNLLEVCKHSEEVKVFINLVPDIIRNSLFNDCLQKSPGEVDLVMGSFRSTEFLTTGYRNAYFDINNYKEHHKAIVNVRILPAIGGGDWTKNTFIYTLFTEITSIKKNIVAYKDNIQGMMHVMDIVNGVLTIARKLLIEAKNNIIDSHLYPPKDFFWSEVDIARKFCDAWGENTSFITREHDKPLLTDFLQTDFFSSGYIDIFGWAPQWDADTSLKKTIEWLKARERGANMQLYTLKQINEYYVI